VTESSILPGTAPAAPADPGVPPPLDFDEPEGGDRRRLIIIGAVLLALVLVVVAFMALKGHGSSSQTLPPVVRGTPPAAQPAPSSSAAAGKTGTMLPKKSTKQLARNPFKPLISTPGPGAGSASSINGAPVTAVTPPASGVGQPTSPSQGGTAPVGGHPQWIELVSTQGSSSALFAVGYAHNKVYRFDVAAPKAGSAQGTVFDGEFSLLSIQDGQATIQVGDDTPFDLRPKTVHSV
jgi:hypothetical protein